MEEKKVLLPKEDNPLTRVVYAYVNGKFSDKELIESIKEMSNEYPCDKNNIKPFDIQKAREGKPVCTRDGRKARIICFDAKSSKPIIALIKRKYDDYEETYSFYEDGRVCGDRDNGYDLMMLPEKKEGWVNVYRDCDGANITKDDNIYSSKEDAFVSAQIVDGINYVATTIINWEE